MIDIDQSKLAKLARERVIGLRNLQEILNIFELTPKQFEEIEAMPLYQRILEHYNIEWNSALTTPERVKLRSASWLEDNLDILGTRMASPTEPLAAVVDVGKFFAKNAGIGEKKDEAPVHDRFVITINLGEDYKLKIDKPIAVSPNDIVPDALTDQTDR